ncbi:MAG: UDP-glucose/GDP-mannose dehydrogenase family protein [Thermomonas sp.]|uniref:UDP-glucose dehydrogenase family protein n=1 Tax=Thermomonas sp. TaxID=1971895 RepID=UPI0039E51705
MKVSIFGTGYVGLVTGTCLASVGHQVTCVDIDADRIARLNRGEIPIHEPGLDALVRDSHGAGRLHFTTDAAMAVRDGGILMIAVGTPQDAQGGACLRAVTAVATAIGQHVDAPCVVVNKSTVPVGTADRVRAIVAGELHARGVEIPFSVVSNPEFLKEGDAVNDCLHPDRIVIGGDDDAAMRALRQLYEPFTRGNGRIVTMDARSAELTKYAANAMLATRISFMNEMATLAEALGADIEQVRQGVGSDPRIGRHFLYPGAGYGGSCFPKDVRALSRAARDVQVSTHLLDAVEAVNERQKSHLFELVNRHYSGDLAKRTFAVWGLAFKPDTDDMREAPSRRLLQQLWDAGARVRAYDPAAMDAARRIYGERDDLLLCASAQEALQGADALVVVTEWEVFRTVDLQCLREHLADAVVFDGRNIYSPERMQDAGLAYYGIGRGASVRQAS